MRWKPGGRDVDWLHAGFSERGGGVSAAYWGRSLNLGWTEADRPEAVDENRRRWMAEVWGSDGLANARPSRGGDPGAMPELVTAAQVHSAESLVVSRNDSPRIDAAGRSALRGDGLMTSEPGILLGIQTADCVPVLVADMRRRAVAAFHAGWRGTAGRIVEHGVEQMRREFGSQPEDMWAAVGPAIAACCYAVGEEVRDRFAAEFTYADELFTWRPELPRWQVFGHGTERQTLGERAVLDSGGGQDRLFLDLHESNRRQLVSGGVAPERIEVFGDCTACSRTEGGAMRYFSYRAEQGRTGRMMALIGIRGAAGRSAPSYIGGG